MSDLLFISLEAWDEVWRRNQFLVAGWARRFPARRVLFVAPALPIGKRVRTFSPKDLPNVRVVCPPKLLPERFVVGRVLNRRALRTFVRREANRFGVRAPLLWLNPYDSGHLCRRLRERGAIYDITDDWELAESDANKRARICKFDRALCRRANLTVVCSQALYDSRCSISRRCLLLPNGVDATHYAAAHTQNSKTQDQNPAFLYTGTLHPERVDVQLIAQLARKYPKGSVELIGPNHLDEGSRAVLKEIPNVRVTPAVPYRDLPARMKPFDVCIVPHRESAFTESLNPIKLWEYLACGKPIASTNVAGFRDYAELCHIGSGAKFVDACANALHEARPQTLQEREQADARGHARRAIAASHSWNARLDALIGELHACKLLS